jgi:two-component system cell cycle sensor histidine kinase/response regulator CckA
MHPHSAGAARDPIPADATEADVLRAILESAAQAIITVDRDGTIRTANAKTGEMFGYTASELIGMKVEDLLPEAVREKHFGHRAGYIASPRVRPMGAGYDLTGQRKDGSVFPVEISLSYVESVSGGVVGIAFISDISARKRLEEQLVQSQKMEAVGRLAGGIAHDFNNLLTIICGYDNLLLKRLSPFDPMRGYAEEILKASERAAALTRQLLAFGRRQIIQPKVLNLNEVLEESMKMLSRLIGENIELKVFAAPDLGNVKVDRSQMEQVILNLVVNARDAITDNGRITIETSNVTLDREYARTHLGVEPGFYVLLAISDNGKGMDAETKRHMFEPFFTTKPVERGTGLGLATVFGIVKQNGGDIWVYSELGQGTTFKIYLPRIPEAAEERRRNSEEKTVQGTDQTILLVEDEEGVRKLISEVLRQNGFKVIEASDALQATQASARHGGDIHLLLTDVVMPHSSGRQLADKLVESRPNMKVLYMSGYTENTVVHHGVLDADVAFLPKPFAFETLLSKISELLNKRE